MEKKHPFFPFLIASVSVWLAWSLITFTEKIYYAKNPEQVFDSWLLVRSLQGANGIWVTLLLFALYSKTVNKRFSQVARILTVISFSYGSSLLLVSMNYPIYRYIFHKTPVFPDWDRYFILAFSKFFVVLLLSILYFLITYLLELRTQKERTLSAEVSARQAQLQMLRYQLNPHFLFNAMNSIRTLIHEDLDKADQLITDLSDFLRYSLSKEDNQIVCLKEEMEAVNIYLQIQKYRFEDNLKTTIEMDKRIEHQPIPCFLIHPLVENAVKYGLETSSTPLKIQISCKTSNNCTEIRVLNSGKLSPPKDPTCNGTGLKNVQLRLDHVFPGRSSFKLSQSGNMVSAVIRIKEDEKREDRSIDS